MAHQHRAIEKKSQDKAWACCVTPDACAAKPERQDAHGSIVRIDFCSCGATRETEINQMSRNRGRWIEGRDSQAVGGAR